MFDIYHHYDGVINLYDVNARAAAAPVQVSDELYAFLRWCKDTAYPAANGATNIAAGAVLRLWHDARESDSPAPPDADAIAAALAHIDIEDLVLDDAAQTVYFADPEVALDVGGLEVHRDIPAADADPEEEEPAHDHRPRGKGVDAQTDDDGAQSGGDHARADGADDAETLDDPTGQGKGEDRAHRHREEGRPELAGAQAELVLGVGDPTGPTREGHPGEAEEGEGGELGALQRLAVDGDGSHGVSLQEVSNRFESSVLVSTESCQNRSP